MPPHKNGDPEYIWITRWEDFQHYAPERDRAPAWIKTYTKQLDDDEYRSLTATTRGLLHDLRMVFPRAHHKLATDTRSLCHRLGYRVLRAQLVSLSHAGFIELVSRETLEQRLEQLYASRARAGAHHREEETERDEESGTSSVQVDPRAVTDLDQPREKPETDPEPETNGTGEIESIATIIQRSLEEARP